MTHWHELFDHSQAAAREPATEEQIDLVEQALRHNLPDPLQAMLLSSNGLYDERTQTEVLWPLERIQVENQSLRTSLEHGALYMPMESLLFFGQGDGAGVLFGFPITKSGAILNAVFAWYPNTDNRVRVANSLEEFVQRWLRGEIRL